MKVMYPRDAKLFHALWKYKILTTHAIWYFIFFNSSMKTTYERLMQLKKGNFIRRVSVGENGFAWSLSVNGYNIVQLDLPELKVPGYGSESPTHDLLVNFAAFGDCWPKLPDHISLLTEEEVKRIPLEYLPSWYPVDLLRRPDGIWNVDSDGKNQLVALELESTLKPSLKYETIAKQYRDANSVFRVVWLVSSKSTAEKIQNAFSEKLSLLDMKHNFILISDMIKFGWSSKFIAGPEKSKTLDNLLNFSNGTGSVPVRRLCHLDLSISPHRSSAYKSIFLSENPNLDTYFKTTPFSSYIKNC
ncbi:MAG: hypothetical protein ACXWR0_05005 [Bdellovibrio sp.]